MDKRTQKQALGEAVAKILEATLAAGDVVLDETSEELEPSFSETDIAYAGGYIGSIAALAHRLSNYVRGYPTA